MYSNFAFLAQDFPVLANFGLLAEKYCYSDSNSCLMKLGMIGETVVNLMFTYDRITLPSENTAVIRKSQKVVIGCLFPICESPKVVGRSPKVVDESQKVIDE